MDPYRLYKLAERWYTEVPRRLNSGRAFPPLQMVLELTYRCNLHCPMCYQRRQEQQLGVGRGKKQGELGLEEIKKIINQTPRWALIIFTGGEPFVRKDVLAILEYASRERRCHIVTNGTLITDEVAEALVGMGLLSVGISIEGDEEVHDSIRGAGTFGKAVGAMKRIRQFRAKAKKRFPLLNIKTTITASNVGSLVKIVDLGSEVGADYCSLQIMNTSLCTSGMYFHGTFDAYLAPPPRIDDFDLDLLDAQLKAAVSRAAEKEVTLRFSPALSHGQILAHYGNTLDVRQFECTALWSGINVSAYGDVYPCLNYRIGNLQEHSLKELWNGERYRNFRKAILEKGLFPGCRGCCDLVDRSRRR